MRCTHACLLSVVVCLGLSACGKKDEKAGGAEGTAAPAAGEPSAEAVAEAKQIFSTRCTPCHGPQGAGDGPASGNLSPRPRNFTDPAWQSSVTDEHIEKIVVYGGAAVGRSPAMPNNPDLAAKPEVVKALRAHVRGLAK